MDVGLDEKTGFVERVARPRVGDGDEPDVPAFVRGPDRLDTAELRRLLGPRTERLRQLVVRVEVVELDCAH